MKLQSSILKVNQLRNKKDTTQKFRNSIILTQYSYGSKNNKMMVVVWVVVVVLVVWGGGSELQHWVNWPCFVAGVISALSFRFGSFLKAIGVALIVAGAIFVWYSENVILSFSYSFCKRRMEPLWKSRQLVKLPKWPLTLDGWEIQKMSWGTFLGNFVQKKGLPSQKLCFFLTRPFL